MQLVQSSAQHADSFLAEASDRGLIVLLTLCLHGILMKSFPIIYGGDPVLRLVNSSRILYGHQLPLLQVLIYCALRWLHKPGSIFLLMALISAASCAGLHALTREITHDRRAAWLAALLYATHPFILYYSRVPYQEPLLMAGMTWGFYYLFRPASGTNRLLSSLFFAAACLTRYEGWIAALVAAIFMIRQNHQREGKIRLLAVARSLAAFGWAPAVWILWNWGLSPVGTYVLDPALHLSRFYRPYFIAKSSMWWTASAVVLAATIGLVHSRIDRHMRNDERLLALLVFVVLLLAALIFSGHGIEPDTERIVTEREAFAPICILVIYAGIGGSRLIGGIQKNYAGSRLIHLGFPVLVVLVTVGYSLDKAVHRIASSNAEPELRTDYEVARFFSGRQANGLILAAPLPDRALNDYLHKAEVRGGPEGKKQAERELAKVETTPLDYQRVLAFSWLGKDRLFSGDEVKGFDRSGILSFFRGHRIEYLVVFSDFAPEAEHERAIMALFSEHRTPGIEIGNSNKSARIYAIESLSCRVQ